MHGIPLVLCAFLGAATAWGNAPQTTIRTDVNLVQLSVRVTDSEGRAVPGLKQDAFQLFVDDIKLPIQHFQSEDAPVTAGIIVDNSASMAPKRDEVIAAALAFARASNSQDQMFVVHFNNRARFGLLENTPFTGSIPVLQEAISRFELGGTTALYDGIVLAGNRMRGAAYDGRALLVITDGGDNSSQASFEDALRSTLEEGAVLYAVGIFDVNDRDKNPGLLTQLAQQTGGEAYFPSEISSVVGVCQHVAAEIRQAYTIGFHGESDGKFHRIRVAATSADGVPLRTHARAGYFAVKP